MSNYKRKESQNNDQCTLVCISIYNGGRTLISKRKTCISSNEKFDFLNDLLEKIPESEPEKVEKRGRPRGASKGSQSESPNNNNNNNNANNNETTTADALSKRGRGRPKKSAKSEETPIDPSDPNVITNNLSASGSIPIVTPPLQSYPPQDTISHPPFSLQLNNNFGSFAEFNVVNFPPNSFSSTLHSISNSDAVNYDEEEEED